MPTQNLVVLQPGALYAAMAVLFLYLPAIPIVWAVTVRKNGGWGPHRDVAYPTNAVALIYDSSLVGMMISGKEGADEIGD